MPRNAERVALVATLRELARGCNVARVREFASRSKVQGMMASIRTADGHEDMKAQAEDTFAKYELTFNLGGANQDGADVEADPGVADVADAFVQPALREFRLRGKSFLFTYNWEFFSKPFPDGTAAPVDAEALWSLWRTWKAEVKRRTKVVKSSHTMEESRESASEYRVHFHWKVDLEQPIDHRTTAAFAFHGVKPDAQTTHGVEGAKQGRGVTAAAASNRGHFYCWAPKIGTVHVGGNWHPFRDYRVNGRWIEDLWSDGKLDHATYQDLSLQVRRGHAARKRDLEEVLADQRAQLVDEQIAKADKALAALKAPFRQFPEVKAWEDSFLSLAFRWKILVLCADSASGKSTYAESLFRNPFVLTVEDTEHLDLKSFDRERHDGVVLDNVNSWSQLLSWRATLQARNAKSKGGQSATNMYAYIQYLFGVAFVATVDLDAPDAYLVNEQHKDHSRWLRKNCVIVRLAAGEAFYDQEEANRLPTVANEFSLFAETVRQRRRLQAAGANEGSAAVAEVVPQQLAATPRRRKRPRTPSKRALPLLSASEDELVDAAVEAVSHR